MASVTLGNLLLTATDAFGVQWVVGNVQGWGASDSTITQTQNARASGARSDMYYSKARTITPSGTLIAQSTGDAADAIDRLIAAANLTGFLFTVDNGNGPRSVTARLVTGVDPVWLSETAVTWSLQIASDDWRKFGTPMTGTTKLPSSSGGLSFGGAAGSGSVFTPDQVNASAQQQGLMITPNGDSGMYDVQNADGSPASASSITMVSAPGTAVSFPLSFNSTVVSGQVNLTNPGNESGPVRIRIDGPCIGPQVAHVSTGNVLTFSSSLVLQAGEWIDIDMEAQTVLANGQSSRAKFITSRGWSGFDPGDNTWSFTATAYTSAAQMSVSATPAWK